MIAGCGGDDDTPTSPTRPIVPSSSFVGTWSGSIVDAEIGGGILRLTIAEHIDRSLFGSWASTFPDAARNDGGSFTGFLNATSSAAFFTLSSASARTCPTPLAAATLAANLTVIGDRMAGEFTSLGCTTVRAGTMELTKQ